jgi:hypothetical protein
LKKRDTRARHGLRKPIVVHDTDDDLWMATLAEAIWPCSKIEAIRIGIEAERQEWARAAEGGR